MVCRTARPKRELVRVVRSPGGSVHLDPGGRLNGRGAYLCADTACWSRAAGPLARALAVTLTPEFQAVLQEDPAAVLADPLHGGTRRDRIGLGPPSPHHTNDPAAIAAPTRHDIPGGDSSGKE